MLIKKDEIFILICSYGCDDDYTILNVYMAMRDLDTKQIMETYLIEHPAQEKNYCFEEYTFGNWLVGRDYIKPAPFKTWHIADYGCIKDN